MIVFNIFAGLYHYHFNVFLEMLLMEIADMAIRCYSQKSGNLKLPKLFFDSCNHAPISPQEKISKTRHGDRFTSAVKMCRIGPTAALPYTPALM